MKMSKIHPSCGKGPLSGSGNGNGGRSFDGKAVVNANAVSSVGSSNGGGSGSGASSSGSGANSGNGSSVSAGSTGNSSGGGPTAAENVDLHSLFECPVCFDFALPPIMQCQSGHIVCAACRAKLTTCPNCRGPLDNIRNLAMEKLAGQVLFPCKYAMNGCPETMYHTHKGEHEDLCEYRPYTCPCPGASCKWQGHLEQVMPHLMHQHKSITTLQGEDIVFLATDINLPGAVDWVMMQSCFGQNFMLVLEKQERMQEQMFYAIVQLIGTRKQAEQFAYRLELNGQRRRLTWEATPRSIHDGVHTAIANSDCLVFDANIAQLFAENGNLGINVTISMATPSSSQHPISGGPGAAAGGGPTSNSGAGATGGVSNSM